MRVLLAGVLSGLLAGRPVAADGQRLELTVHAVQANNDSPYTFVRARFEPGEVSDPWAVRFSDQRGKEVPFFVWDSITWKTAREGRADWGNRYAILNHHPGDAPPARGMRARRLEAAREQLSGLGEALSAQDGAARRQADSVCAALYLLRHPVPAFGKARLTLRVDPTRQAPPARRKLEGTRVEQRTSAAAGELILDGLPDRPVVRWKGRELFRYAGFRLDEKTPAGDGPVREGGHLDPARPFSLEIEEGIITRLSLRGQTNGRAGAAANWQCTYWLFPEGAYAALKGFSLENAAGYLGGGLTPAIWEMPARPQEIHQPSWEEPWWLFRIGEDAFIAAHQFPDIPLAVGYGNNPFNASTPGSFRVWSGERNKGQGDGAVELRWQYDLTDPRICRLFHPLLESDRSNDLSQVTDLRETLLGAGKLTRVPLDAVGKNGELLWPPERVRALEEALAFVRWRRREDWLYRQYLAGVGSSAAGADRSVRQVLGAACGWVDRPFDEEEAAELLVRYSIRKSSRSAPSAHHQAWTVLPALLYAGDPARVEEALTASADPAAGAAGAREMIRKHTAAGGSPIQGTTKGGGEGWHGNPAYFAVDVPVALRFLDHFGLARTRRPEYRTALLGWADFSLETLGGRPLDQDRLLASYRALWPNRLVMLVPLMLRAHRESGDERYARAARLLFDEVLMKQVERNPHGYFWAWADTPAKAEPFDLNYNPAAYDRGIIDFWSEGQLDLLGRERAAGFAAAQARYLAFSGQLLDTLETDSMTAVQSQYPGGVPFALGQVALFLYDDFEFYRGLLGSLIRWGVIDDGGTVEDRQGRRNLYSMKIGTRGAIFWAYGIGRDAPPRSRTAREMAARWRSGRLKSDRTRRF